MTKYNIQEKKEKDAAYRHLLSSVLVNELKEKIVNIVVKQKKYKDKNYSAKQLATDIGTNTRYISAVVNLKFQRPFSIHFQLLKEKKRTLNLRVNKII